MPKHASEACIWLSLQLSVHVRWSSIQWRVTSAQRHELVGGPQGRPVRTHGSMVGPALQTAAVVSCSAPYIARQRGCTTTGEIKSLMCVRGMRREDSDLLHSCCVLLKLAYPIP